MTYGTLVGNKGIYIYIRFRGHGKKVIKEYTIFYSPRTTKKMMVMINNMYTRKASSGLDEHANRSKGFGIFEDPMTII